MNCVACGTANPERAKFCVECGAPFAARCGGCGVELPAAAKFCPGCGMATAGGAAPRLAAAAPSPASDTRKVVTIVFADLVGSTALHERLDAESARRFMGSYYAAMRGAVESHGGTVTQLLGDGVKAVFGIPRVAEDDAIRAVRAAAAMQDAFRALAEDQRGSVGATGLRVAVNTGEVVANDAAEIIGDPVNVAARLQEQGRDGDVVVGEATHRLVATRVTLEPLGRFALKGRSEAVTAYRVVSLERPAGAAAAAFVGRDDELARLAAVYETAVAKPAAALAVLLGSPGLGKSRLIDEFARRLGGAATVVQAHCDAEGGATFAPLAVALRALLALEDGAGAEALRAAVEAALPDDDDDRPRIASGIASLLAGSPDSPEETFFVVRRLLAALAQAKPVVLVIDDLHWAEPLLLDLVEHLVQWGSGVALTVLVGARPELRDLRSSLAAPGGLVADVVALAGLDAGAAMQLAANVIGAADLPAAIAAKVLATSEGNPLFVGELVRMLVQEGALTKDGDRWTAGANLAALEMPPTIHALLAARIERLRPEERSVLERAAVVGRHFSRGAVASLLPRGAAGLDARLEALRRSELIEGDAGWLLGEPLLRFHHVLIRDAAYRRLLKGTRAELHAALADWIEAQVGDAAEHDETIGWHLEQAHAFLRELGPLDDAGRALGERAAQRLAAAGRRALGRDDLPVAADLLGRALERLDVDDPKRAELALDGCEALLSAGDVGAASRALDELGRFTAGSGRLRAWHTCFTGQLTVLTAPEALHQTSAAVAEAARELTELGDAAGEAKAHFVNAQALARLGRVGACEAALDQALAAARRAGDRRRANAVLAGAPLAALWGPSPVTRASGRCLDVVRVLRITQGAPAVESVALSCQGVLEALRGRTEAARRMLASSRQMVEELGIAHRLFEVDAFAGRIELLEGDAASAERLLRGAYDGLRVLGLGIDAAQAGALLARALLAQDRVAEAEAVSHESEALAGDGLQAAIAWRGVRAEALARRGEHEAAISLARAAVAIAAATDALLDHADARMALAAALRAAGRGAEADAEERRAIELWDAKGATLLAERARGEGGRAAPLAVPAAEPGTAWPTPGLRTGPSARERLPRRRVRPNAATRALARFDAACAAGDLEAAAAQHRGDLEETDHPTGSSYGLPGARDGLRRLLRAQGPHMSHEPLATLGARLALASRSTGARATAGGRFDVGVWARDELVVAEVDGDERLVATEIFAGDRLGDALVRLHARYAGSIRDAPERERAAAVAHAVAAYNGPIDIDRVAQVYLRTIRHTDHRVLATWSARNAEELLRHWRLQLDLAPNFAGRYDDVLALEPDALAVQMTFFGDGRDSGGAFENRICVLFAFGADGRVASADVFEPDGEAEALARFDALVAGTQTRAPARRPVRPNAATSGFERFAATLAARDRDALAQHFDESLQVVHHPSGTTYGRREMLATWRGTLKAERFEFRQEIIATLGEALALDRHLVSVEGLADSHLAAFGHAEFDEISLLEVDDRGRWLRSEIFAPDRLGEAIGRLYERYAERQPEGAARARAAATARAARVMLGQPDLGATAAVLAPDVEFTDLRTVGIGRLRGAAAVIEKIGAMMELSSHDVARVDDVVAAGPDAIVVRWTNRGTDRATDGSFERRLCQLFAFGPEGTIAHWQQLEDEEVGEALARFDALAGGDEAEPRESPFANAASRANRRRAECFNARDWAGVEACVAPALVFDERRRLLRNTADRETWLAQTRLLFELPRSRFAIELLATRGERLSLHLHRFEGEVAGGGGPLALDDHLSLHEVDRDGRIVAIVLFDLDDRDAAYAELDGRSAADPGSPHAYAVLQWLHAVARRDWDAVVALCSPAFVEHDHRPLAVLGTTHGAEAWARNFSTLVELAPDTAPRFEHTKLGAGAVLWTLHWRGTREGGDYEIPLCGVLELDAQGRIAGADIYDPDQLDQARARFEELERDPRGREA